LQNTDTAAHPVDIHVGHRIRMRRKFMKVSQSDLAEAIGLTFQQVQKYERGSNRISASKLHQASSFLRAPISYFFEGLGPEEYSPNAMDQELTHDAFLSVEGGIELAQLYPRIRNPEQRLQILKLVQSLAETD
jgi:transcriptional regulator with XRE-family HTH domain